jgi:prolyl-tRNA synthetase
VFQLGRKYADAFGLTARGPDGKPLTVTDGSTPRRWARQW